MFAKQTKMHLQAIVMYIFKFEPYLHRCLVRTLFKILEISEFLKYLMLSLTDAKSSSVRESPAC